MKKILFTLLVLEVTACTSFAQTKDSSFGKFSPAADVGLPIGYTNKIYDLAVGGSLKYDVHVDTGASVNLTAGYEEFIVKKSLKKIGWTSPGFIPVKVGFKYYFNDLGFYGEGQLGFAFSTESGGGKKIAYAPGAGYTLDGGVDVGVRYEGWSNNGTINNATIHNGAINQVAFRMAYNF